MHRLRILERALERDDIERAAQPAEHRDLAANVVYVGCLPLGRETGRVEAFGDGLAGEIRAGSLVGDDADL